MPKTKQYTTSDDPRLFMDLQGGRIVCRKHLGGYGITSLNAHPEGEVRLGDRMVWVTPLDVWTVMTDADRAQFTKDMADYGFESAVAKCEDCGYTPDDPELLAERLLGVGR